MINNMNMPYSINDEYGLASALRDIAANNICENHNDDLDDYISLDQIVDMIHQYSCGTDDGGMTQITENDIHTIVDDITNTIYQIGLSKLASNGDIECAWDDDTNQMMFWVNNE